MKTNTEGSAKYVQTYRDYDKEGYTKMIKDLCAFYNVPYNTDEWKINLNPSAGDYYDSAVHIVNMIMENTNIPAGKTIKGLKQTKGTHGSYEEFYKVVFD